MRSRFLNGAALAVGILLLAAGGPWLVRQIASLPRPAALAARASQRAITLEIGGMTCEGCAKSVTAQIAAVPGVSAVGFSSQQLLAGTGMNLRVAADGTSVPILERPLANFRTVNSDFFRACGIAIRRGQGFA